MIDDAKVTRYPGYTEYRVPRYNEHSVLAWVYDDGRVKAWAFDESETFDDATEKLKTQPTIRHVSSLDDTWQEFFKFLESVPVDIGDDDDQDAPTKCVCDWDDVYKYGCKCGGQ